MSNHRVECKVRMDEEVWLELKDHSYESGMSIADVLEDAIFELLKRKSLRPIYMNGYDGGFSEYDRALKRIAR